MAIEQFRFYIACHIHPNRCNWCYFQGCSTREPIAKRFAVVLINRSVVTGVWTSNSRMQGEHSTEILCQSLSWLTHHKWPVVCKICYDNPFLTSFLFDRQYRYSICSASSQYWYTVMTSQHSFLGRITWIASEDKVCLFAKI